MPGNPLFATKSVDALRAEADAAHGLKRTLGPFDLVMLGIGAIIGAGLFVRTAAAAANNAALTFVQWLSSPAQGAYLTGQSSGLPSGPSQLSYPAVQKEEASQPTYQVFANQLNTGQTRPSIPAYTAISTALATEINAALTGGITPAAALAKAAATGDQAIASGSGS